jgi:YVTN family beta-propeller protein
MTRPAVGAMAVVPLRRVMTAAVALGLAAACGGTSDPPQATRTPRAAATTEATATPVPAADPDEPIAVGAGACALARAGGGVWVTALQDEAVVRIDPRTRVPGVTVPVEGHPCWLVGDERSVWVAPSEAATVVELDARTGSERGRVEIGDGLADPKLALAGDSVWATVTPSGEVVKIDRASRRVTARVPTGRDPRSVISGGGLIWVANEGSGTVVGIDPDRARVVRSFKLPRVTMLVGFARGSVWAAQSSRRRVTRLDARTGRRLATVRVGGNPSAGLVSGGRIYVPNHLEDTVSIISTATGKVRNVTVGNYPSALVDVGDDVWVANYGDGTVQTLPAR